MTLNHSGLHKRKKKGASFSKTGNPNSLNSPGDRRTQQPLLTARGSLVDGGQSSNWSHRTGYL